MFNRKTVQQWADDFHFYIGKLDLAFLAVIFTYFSNVGTALKSFLQANGDKFFPVAGVLKTLDWLSYTIVLYYSGNKNINKIATFAIKTIETILIGMAVWGGKMLGTVTILTSSVGVGAFIFAGLFSFGFLYNLAHFIFFATKAYLSHKKGDEVAEAFYKGEAIQHSMNIALTLFGLGTVLLAMVFPQVMAGIVAAVVLTTVAIIITMVVCRGTRVGDWVLEGINEIKNRIFPSKEPPQKEMNDYTINHVLDALKKNDYHANTIALKRTNYLVDTNSDRTQINQAIENYKTSLNNQITKSQLSTKEHFWPEQTKRQNKIKALDFLQAFITESNFISKVETLGTLNEIRIKDHTFKYRNVNDLTDQVHEYVIETYDQAFQSILKDTGSVEFLFKKTYDLVRTPGAAIDIESSSSDEFSVHSGEENLLTKTTPINI